VVDEWPDDFRPLTTNKAHANSENFFKTNRLQIKMQLSPNKPTRNPNITGHFQRIQSATSCALSIN
jgi:hypothetical protein